MEVFSFTSLRQRASAQELHATHRYEFHLLICVTRGECTHTVDFTGLACRPGSVLVVKSGQVHRMAVDEDWDGWMVLFRPEILSARTGPATDEAEGLDFDVFPQHLALQKIERRIVTDAIRRMRDDAASSAPPAQLQTLLRHQLCALLARLAILSDRWHSNDRRSVPGRRLYRTFEGRLNRNIARWHKVSDYAKDLGCSQKSLTRASLESAGVAAKTLIASRIALEAKRLLAHTPLSVTAVAERLGFSEPTNFIKFFRREAGCTPAAFRAQQRDGRG